MLPPYHGDFPMSDMVHGIHSHVSAKSEPMYYHTFLVTGRGEFPFDMLRYDSCFPVDAGTPGLYSVSNRNVRAIKMASWQRNKYWAPTTGRWSSFGWSVSTEI